MNPFSLCAWAAVCEAMEKVVHKVKEKHAQSMNATATTTTTLKAYFNGDSVQANQE